LGKEDPQESATFVRLRRDADQQPVALETAIARFVGQDQATDAKVVVDLVGAIHVGDKTYYAALNQRFRRYDAVLYELVAAENANVPQPGQSPGTAVGGVQVGMKSMLALEFQLDCIDYKAKNMVHADMSPEEFQETMKQRNESFLGMFFRVMGRSFGEQAKDPTRSSDLKLLTAMFAKDRAQQLKLVMAEQFAEMEGAGDMFGGPEGSTILTERNKKALEVLRRELGKGKKKLAIFYGAAHLPDLRERLEADFRLKRTHTDWLPAWSLTTAP
jgi:hypothetical protein